MSRTVSLYLASLAGLALLAGTSFAPAGENARHKGNVQIAPAVAGIEGTNYVATLHPIAAGDDKKPGAQKDREPDVIYVPTPQEAVEAMLKMAKVTKDDIVWDLGCGDGRIPVTAAKKYGCKARGFDVDPERIRESQENVKKNEVGKLVTIEKKDIFTLDLSKEPTVITLYLLPDLNVKLLPQLKKLPKGARIVSHAFKMGDIHPDEEKSVKTDRGEVTIYLWKVETLQNAKK